MQLFALVAVVFGVHSALDWTWFVPAVAMTALFCAGWVAGRGPLTAPSALSAVQRAAPPSARSRPCGPASPSREQLKRRIPAAAALIVVAAVSALAISQPWRAEQKGDDALRLADAGDYAAARQAAEDAKDLNPLSVQPYFELAAVEDAAGRSSVAAKLARARGPAPAREPGGLAAARRLLPGLARRPDRALPVLRGALFLDPVSTCGTRLVRRRSAGGPARARRGRASSSSERARRAARASRASPARAASRAASGIPPAVLTRTCSNPKSRSSPASERFV